MRFITTGMLFFTALISPGVSLAADHTSATAARKPNIIFILSDDVGIGNIGCYGSDKFKTPHIDALAKSGIRSTMCFALPLCGPSRALLLTGRYPFRTGMVGNQTGSVLKPQNEIMTPAILKKGGYVSAQVGKWSQLPLKSGDWGFDEYLQIRGSGKYWAEQEDKYQLNGTTKTLPPDKYLPDLMHEFVVDFMKRHKDQPFFIHYALSHMHSKIMRTPDSPAGHNGKNDFYADNNAYMDKLVGMLVKELEKLGLRENTLVIFVGDNGTTPNMSDLTTIGGRRISGNKATMLEGGSLVPFIASWPGTTPADTVTSSLVDFSDFLPTFAELAGASLPTGVKIDGKSFAPHLKGLNGNSRDWAYVELNGKWYVRSADWKLTHQGELYDMKGAPFVEKLVPADTHDTQAIAARETLQGVLNELNPAEGKQRVGQAPANEAKSRKKARKQSKKEKAAQRRPADPTM